MPTDFYNYYYPYTSAAFVRGQLIGNKDLYKWFQNPLSDLSLKDCEGLYRLGIESGLRLHRFKRSSALPRVSHVLGILKGMQPYNLLDIGSGRGVFLWPLIDQFPFLPITAIDRLDYRVDDIHAVSRGGLKKLQTLQMDAECLAFGNNTFDGITLLETLEHSLNPQRVINEVCRVTKRFVIITVPSKEDTNSEHIHLFDKKKLKELFDVAGSFRVKFEYVPNHIVAIALK